MLLTPSFSRATGVSEKRKSAATQMKKEFSRLGIHKLYVPDFCNSSRASGPGVLFASIFSLALKDAKDFTVLSRSDAHNFLVKNKWTDCDLSNPDTLLCFSREFGVDSILTGTMVPADGSFSIDLVLHDLSGKELTRLNYSEPYQAGTVGMFPAISTVSGWPFFLPGYDGVTLPQAIRMTNPAYPQHARTNHISGCVDVSAIVTTEGKIEQARVVQKVEPEMDRVTLETVNGWRFKPAKSADGTSVPVRVVFQINFTLFH